MNGRVIRAVTVLLLASTTVAEAAPADTTRGWLGRFRRLWKPAPVEYEKGFYLDRLLRPREFHAPVNFIPIELRYGFGYNGGRGFLWLRLKEDWIKYQEEVAEFRGGNIFTRLGHQLDLDLLKTNLAYYLLKSSWADMHTGLNLRYATVFFPPPVPTTEWGVVNPTWNPGERRFAPRILELSWSQSLMVQWAEWWYLNFRYTYGLASTRLYQGLSTPTGWGPSASYTAGVRVILDPGQEHRFSVGLEVKTTSTQIKHIRDPDDLTPINGFTLSNYGIFLTLGVFYGGRKTSGDVGKVHYFHRDYVAAKVKLSRFVTDYPNHANRHRAEWLLAEATRKIPYQYMREGLNFDQRDLTDRALQRYLQARPLADSTLLGALEERIAQIAKQRLYDAKELLQAGRGEEALVVVQKVAGYYTPAEDRIPHFQARVYLQQAKTALGFGFHTRALELLDQALKQDPELKFQIAVLQYQIAVALVEEANRIDNPEYLRLAVESLQTARELTGGLGPGNEDLLRRIEQKLAEREDFVLQRKIEARMEEERQKAEEVMEPVTLGMTIPQVQDILGPPRDMVHRSVEGEDQQLWIYDFEGRERLLLTFVDFILFKIEEGSR